MGLIILLIFQHIQGHDGTHYSSNNNYSTGGAISTARNNNRFQPGGLLGFFRIAFLTIKSICMGEINRAAGLSDKDKNRNGWKYVIILVVVGAAALFINHLTDSWAYTSNPEAINKKILLVIGIPVVLAVAIGLIFFRNNKKK